MKPAILLAFANDTQNVGDGFLRKLAVEKREVRKALALAQTAKLCDFEILDGASVDEIFTAFREKKWKDRVAIFHFSGHAGSFELMLEDEKNRPQRAHADGFMPFLASQPELQLVFLNGCFSQKQAEELSNLGIPAVIGTVKSVKDEDAKDFSIAFYENVAAGFSIEIAYKNACLLLKTKRGDSFQHKLLDKNSDEETRESGFEREDDDSADDRFPWEIVFRAGAENAKNWNLPDAADNPLFGLPLPDSYELPERPFRFLDRFERADARVFFGRGRFIRDLHQRLSSTQTMPVVLLYGQSGVGKSSLLNAGLWPRLEEKMTIRSFSRKLETDLVAALRKALDLPPTDEKLDDPTARKRAILKIQANISSLESVLPNLTGEALQLTTANLESLRNQQNVLKNPPTVDFRARWKSLEKADDDKPLLVFIDQVEEIFTRPNPLIANELASFLEVVQQIFNDKNARPAGKLLLSFRKEFHPEIKAALVQASISHEDAFLQKLDHRDIEEIVGGLDAEQNFLFKNKYNLTVEADLPALIADDLLADKDSSVAPVLQIVLSKMWEIEKNKDNRVFSKTEYERLKDEGILLDEIFKKQMEKFQAWNSKLEASGLALDVLNEHTTALGTAESRSLEELRILYGHEKGLIEKMLAQFKELYLLTDADLPDLNPDDPPEIIAKKRKTGLAHDTLAPIVQREITISERPGQRAFRILRAKMADFDLKPEETVIEEEDLQLIEQGKAGMRIWKKKEVSLIEKSRLRRAKLMAERLRNRVIKYSAAIGAVVAAVVFYWLWQRVRVENMFNEGRLEVATDPTAGIQKMHAACLLDPSDLTKWRGYFEVFSSEIFYDTTLVVLENEAGGFNKATFSMDGKAIAAATSDHVFELFLEKNVQKQPLENANAPIAALAFGPDGLTLFGGAKDRKAYAWKKGAEKHALLFDSESAGGQANFINSISISANGQRVCTGHDGPFFSVWEAATGKLEHQYFLEKSVVKTIAAIAPSGEFFIAGQDDGAVHFFKKGNDLPVFSQKNRQKAVTAVAFSNDGRSACAGFDDGVLMRWSLDSLGHFHRRDSAQAHAAAIRAVVFSPDGQFVLTGSDDATARLWPQNGPFFQPKYTLRGHRGSVHSVGFNASTNLIFTASEDGTVRRWPLVNPRPSRFLETSEAKISKIAFSNGGGWLLAASEDSKIYRWVLPDFEKKEPFSGHARSVSWLATAAETAVSADENGTAQVWNFQKNTSLGSNDFGGELGGLAISFDGKWVAAFQTDSSKIKLWNWSNGQKIELPHGAETVVALAFSPDGRVLKSASFEKNGWSWKLPSGQFSEKTPLDFEPTGLAFQPDGSSFLVLSESDTARFFQKNDRFQPVLTGKEVVWKNAERFVGAGFSKNESLISVKTTAGFSVFNFEKTGDPTDWHSLAIHPSGRWLASGRSDGKIGIWLVPSEK